jgi:hypothetical protein
VLLRCGLVALSFFGACASSGSGGDGGPTAPPGGAGGAAGEGGGGGEAGRAPPLVADPNARTRLSEAGFFAAAGSQAPAADLVAFEPHYPLWSDGTDKRRWLWLPPGTKVDASDADHWRFPVGARLYKEFSQGGKRLETRLIERWGPGPDDYWMGAFVWLDDQSDAVYAEAGAPNVLGTEHDVPEAKRCDACHNGEPGRVLGFSALQVGGAPFDALIEPARPPAAPPGGPAARDAFGYLHANCGPCHYDGGIAWRETDIVLRLAAAESAPEATALFASTVGVPAQLRIGADDALRVTRGAPDQSALLLRMAYRGDDKQMPPLASERIDEAGVALVRAWIASLPP